MAIIKFDVSSSDPEAAQAGSFESPQPGVYSAKIKSMTPGFSKGQDGKEDKNRPRIEVIFQITDERYKGSQMWYYLTFGESALWKLDQFLQTFGLASGSKRSGQFDTNKLVNKPCKVRVRAGKDLDGNYRGEVAAVLPPGEGDGAGSASDDADIFGDTPTDVPDDQAIQEEAAEELSENTDGAPDDDDMIIDDDEVIEEEKSISEDDLKAMSPPEVAEVAKQFDISVKGKKKSQVIVEIMEKAAAASSGDDEEMPF